MKSNYESNTVNLKNMQFRAVTAECAGEGYRDGNGFRKRGLEDEIANVVSQLLNMGYTDLVSIQYGVGSSGIDGDIEPFYSALIVARAPGRD